MKDFISVLLPLYNAQDTLEACLQSIFQQQGVSLEILAVDDGSTDSSPKILQDFAALDSRLRIITLPKNQGIVAALNAGLAACRGTWVARMDADDRMHPQRLYLQWDYLRRNTQIDLLGAQIKLFQQEGTLRSGQIRYQDWSNSLCEDTAIKREIFAESPIMHPTFFASKDFFERMGGYQDNAWAEDYDFLLRAYLSEATFAKLPQVLVEKGDSPSRLARVDPRCKRKAMFEAKAHYFAQTKAWQAKKNLVVCGTGSSAKLLGKALKKNGVRIHAFTDNKPQIAGRSLMNCPVFTLTPETAKEFFSEYQDTFFLLTIGEPRGKAAVQSLLQQNGFEQEKDFLRFL